MACCLARCENYLIDSSLCSSVCNWGACHKWVRMLDNFCHAETKEAKENLKETCKVAPELFTDHRRRHQDRLRYYTKEVENIMVSKLA